MPWPKGRKLTRSEVAVRVAAGRDAAMRRRRRPRLVAGCEFWRCTECDCWFASEHFFRTKTNSSGLTSRCRSCHIAQSIRTRDPERHRKTKLASVRRQRAANPARFRELELKRAFGISLADYEGLCATQGGVCAICKRPERDTLGRRLAVDHDHDTGAIRGLLCRNCNTGLGMLGDSVDRIVAAANYLLNAQKKEKAA